MSESVASMGLQKRKKRILVVDDDARSRKLLETILAALGHDVEAAPNGNDAIHKLATDPDLILLDIMMPGMDGFNVIRQIREQVEFAGVPIIMVTLLNSKADRIKAIESGANDFISKPIDALELSVRVASLLKVKEAQDQLKNQKRELADILVKRTAELNESERRFRALYETAKDLIFFKDTNLVYTDANPAMVDFLKIPLMDLIGKKDEDLYATDYVEQARNIEIRVLDGQTLETQLKFKYRMQQITLDVARFPLRSPSGIISGICGIAREITDYQPLSFVSENQDFLSETMQNTLEAALLAADTDSMILLMGESGSGKDFMARYIHDHSKRSAGPFYAINCAAIPTELAESELFGHEAGAFTGANRARRGMLELAESGTILLNEIGELSKLLQAKLLTFLDTRTFSRVGGEKHVTVNARIIAATNRDLETEVANGRFRSDLFHRLNVFSIKVPPLRERSADIVPLVTGILATLKKDLQLPNIPYIEPDVYDAMQNYYWPGNVRELKNVLERAIILSRGSTIKLENIKLGDAVCNGNDRSAVIPFPLSRPLNDLVDDMEREIIEQALQSATGNKLQAARLLGISRFALSRHMKKLGIYIETD